MSHFIFFLRTFALTVAVVLLMQIEVNQRSIESHALAWVHTSKLVEPMNSAAKGAARLAREVYESVRENIKNPFR